MNFDKNTHTYYTDDKIIIPSCTEILKSFGVIKFYGNENPEKMQLGKYIHRAIELYTIGRLKEETLDEKLKPYLDSYKKFISDTGFKYRYSEKALHSEEYWYACTVDLMGYLDKNPVCIDIKTGSSISDWVALQTAAQVGAAPKYFKNDNNAVKLCQ